MEEKFEIWLSDTQEVIRERADSLLKCMKENCSTYGELDCLIHKFKRDVLFQKKFQRLEPVFDVLYQLIESEKNALSIRED
ncbi:hypothetical protein NY607_12245 [Lysinibacillus sp. A4]|uniref:hypothetical protein n=1 Tax=Lysinibacillus sp. A4 TaxID=2976269 RepID=UPI002175DCD7|nr:hypothetical protein [Lysinibacillus sp. A4]MCS5501896.1 hypothetical protein [Lysinibacillus sp. A4]